VLACVTIAIAYFLLNKIKNFALPRFYWIVIFIAFIYIYVPHFLLGISSKYAYAIKNWGTDNYLTNYFSTFSIALLIATIIIFLVIKMKYKFVLPMILTLLYFSSLLNLYTNYHAAEDLKDTYHLTNAIDLLKETETFKALPPNAKLYSPELYNKISISNINSEYFDWSKYFNLFNNKKIQVIKTIDTSNIDNTYYLRTGLNKKHSEVFFVWSKIKNINEQNIIGDTVTIFNYSTIKNYSVQLYKQSNDSVVYINNNKIISKGLIQNIPIFYNDTHDPLTTTKIIGKDIILNSVVLHQNILQ
jgi:hypothetical protein